MSDPILLALLRQLLRREVLTDMDVQAMAADLQREGFDTEAHSVNVALIEAIVSDGGNVAD